MPSKNHGAWAVAAPASRSFLHERGIVCQTQVKAKPDDRIHLALVGAVGTDSARSISSHKS
jgi:hypothetical protein